MKLSYGIFKGIKYKYGRGIVVVTSNNEEKKDREEKLVTIMYKLNKYYFSLKTL